MARPALTPLVTAVAGIAAIGCLAYSSPAEAAMVTYDFTVDVTKGNAIGKYTGQFSFNFDETSNPLVPCSATSQFLCAFATQHKVTAEFNFLGKKYTETADRDFGTKLFPAIYFTKNKTLIGLSLIATPPAPEVSFALLGSEFYQGFNIYPNEVTKVDLVGTIRYMLRVPGPGPGPDPEPDPCQRNPGSCNPVAVPEPSAVIGSTAALGLLSLWRSRRRKPTSDN